MSTANEVFSRNFSSFNVDWDYPPIRDRRIKESERERRRIEEGSRLKKLKEHREESIFWLRCYVFDIWPATKLHHGKSSEVV